MDDDKTQENNDTDNNLKVSIDDIMKSEVINLLNFSSQIDKTDLQEIDEVSDDIEMKDSDDEIIPENIELFFLRQN